MLMSFSVAAEDRTRTVYATACQGRLTMKEEFPSRIPNIRTAWKPIQVVVLHLSII